MGMMVLILSLVSFCTISLFCFFFSMVKLMVKVGAVVGFIDILLMGSNVLLMCIYCYWL